jgi:hypothetical protein
MPRERGKPKRGPLYYNYVARQRRLHHFSQFPPTPLDRHDREGEEPPMAIVEEEIPSVSVQIPPPSLLYIVPDPQDPSPLTGCSAPDTVATSDWATCIIEEEISQEIRHEETLPPPSTALDQGPCSTCSLSPEHLDLIFDMRRDMQEQLHRHTLLNNRLDLLFDSLSRNARPTKVPNLHAQPFIFTPAGNTHGDKGFTGSSTA